MAGRGGAWAAALLLGGAVLVLRTALRPQRAQSLEVANGEWEVPGTVQDDDGAEVAAGHKVLNRGRINWYWIPPKAEPSPAGLPRRLDASAAAAGDPRSSKAGLSPLVLDHVFTTDEGRQAWANVHAFDHGELLTGQMRMVHREPPPPPPPPPPERHEDLDGVLHGVIDEAIASAFAKVMSAPPPPSSDDTPEKPEEEGGQSEEASASVTEEADTKEADTRKKLEPIKNPPTHLPWEEKIEESNEAEAVSVTTTAVFTTTPTPTPTTPTPTTTPRPAPTEEQVSEAIAEAVEKEEERKEEENIKEEEKPPEASEMECSSSVYSENGCCCEIPFEYGGESHTNCTLMDHTSFWCYVQDEGCGKQEQATGKWWDTCWPGPETPKRIEPPKIKRKPRKIHKPGMTCGSLKNRYTPVAHPWLFKSDCNDDEICQFDCKNGRCVDCDGGNCKCVPIKEDGEPCGENTHRGPDYSHAECKSGKCAYNCVFCSNCDGGNCVCLKGIHIRGT